MQISAIHVVPVGIFDASEFVELGNSFFDGRVEKKPIKNNDFSFLTSLKSYNSNSNCFEISNSKSLKEFIIKSAKEYCIHLGYDADHYDFNVPNIWINEMYAGSVSPPHSHYGYHFSGTFYVMLPEESDVIEYITPLSRIDKATINISNYTNYNSHIWRFNPKVGDLYIWESYIQHGVPSKIFEGNRRSIAFDIKLTDKEIKN